MKLKPLSDKGLECIERRQEERVNQDFPFGVCDIEASDWSKFRMIGFYDGVLFRHFLSLNDFLDYLEGNELYRRGEKAFDIFAHFGGGYDFKFIMEAAFCRDDVEVTNIIPHGTTAKILCFDVLFYDTGIKYHFSDSLAFLPFSLKDLCKKFNPKSKKIDDFDVRSIDIIDEKTIEYNRFDCESLHQIITMYETHPFISKVGLRPTVASQAMSIFRLFLQNDICSLVSYRKRTATEEIDAHRESVMKHDTFIRGSNEAVIAKNLTYRITPRGGMNAEEIKHDAWIKETGELPAYFGGRTEVFKPWFSPSKAMPHLNYYDFNSLYPSVMWENEFPHFPISAMSKFDDRLMGFWEVTVSVPTPDEDPKFWIPPLGMVHKLPEGNKFLFPVGEFTGKWSTPELVYALSLGVKIKKFHRGVRYSSSGRLFHEYVTRLYEMRLEAKKKNDSVMDVISKLLLNSLYGRFGLNCVREQLQPDDFSEGSGDTEFILDTPNGEIGFCRKEEMSKLFSNVAIASYVTTYGRIKLHKALLEAEDAWYCDTDSIITSSEMEHSNVLGALKLEQQIDGDAAFILPKAYAYYASKNVDSIKNPLGKVVKVKGLSDKLVKRYTPSDLMDFFRGTFEIRKLEARGEVIEAARKREKLTVIRTEVFDEITDNHGNPRLVGKGLKGLTRALHDDRRMVANENPLIREIRCLYDKRKLIETSNGISTMPWEIKDGEIIE
jgi:hypothetical protein